MEVPCAFGLTDPTPTLQVLYLLNQLQNKPASLQESSGDASEKERELTQRLNIQVSFHDDHDEDEDTDDDGD